MSKKKPESVDHGLSVVNGKLVKDGKYQCYLWGDEKFIPLSELPQKGTIWWRRGVTDSMKYIEL